MVEDIRQQILVVEDEDINIYSVSPEIQLLSQEEELIPYVDKNYKDFDSFDIYTDGRHMDRLLRSGVFDHEQIKRVTFYFDSLDDIRQPKQSFSENSSKFEFCLKKEVANRIQNAATCIALKSSSRLDPKIVKLNAKQRRCRIRRKQGSLVAESSSSIVTHSVGFDVRNVDVIDGKYFCECCGYILRNPVQLNCGHRVCESCAKSSKENSVRCPECSEETSEKEIRIDKGFIKDMQTLNINCSLCGWAGQLKEYENHLHQSHPNPSCKYCGQNFQSTSHLSMHQRIYCHMTSVPCALKDYGCSNTVNRFEIGDHYLTEKHQLAIMKAVYHLSNNPPNIQYENDFETVGTELQSALNETLNIFAGGIQALNNEVEARSNEIPRLQDATDTLTRNLVSMQSSVEQQNVHLDRLERLQELLQQSLTLLQEETDNMQPFSYDGTLVWRIDNVLEKMNDARSERQTSIYSPTFYSSPTGYKMRARLYLYGDGNARRTHVSLFLVLMRGELDARLEWPFKYKVTFCLFDQTPAQQHIIDSLRPDITSASFQRPQSEMNIASGIPKFCPVERIEQENNPYVRDDTIFIKVMLDFGQIPDELLPYALGLNPGIPTHRQYEMVLKEVDKSCEHQ